MNTMTVKDLRKMLRNLPDSMPVFIYDSSVDSYYPPNLYEQDIAYSKSLNEFYDPDVKDEVIIKGIILS